MKHRAEDVMTSTVRAGSTYSSRQQRLIAAQGHVSVALILAAVLFWRAGEQLNAQGSWELQLVMVLAAGVALVGAVAPWVLPDLSPRTQRICIWQPLLLAAIPSVATVTYIGFEAAGACQLLLIAGVLAEIGARRRILLFLWGVAAVTFAISLWHLRGPWL